MCYDQNPYNWTELSGLISEMLYHSEIQNHVIKKWSKCLIIYFFVRVWTIKKKVLSLKSGLYLGHNLIWLCKCLAFTHNSFGVWYDYKRRMSEHSSIDLELYIDKKHLYFFKSKGPISRIYYWNSKIYIFFILLFKKS